MRVSPPPYALIMTTTSPGRGGRVARPGRAGPRAGRSSSPRRRPRRAFRPARPARPARARSRVPTTCPCCTPGSRRSRTGWRRGPAPGRRPAARPWSPRHRSRRATARRPSRRCTGSGRRPGGRAGGAGGHCRLPAPRPARRRIRAPGGSAGRRSLAASSAARRAPRPRRPGRATRRAGGVVHPQAQREVHVRGSRCPPRPRRRLVDQAVPSRSPTRPGRAAATSTPRRPVRPAAAAPPDGRRRSPPPSPPPPRRTARRASVQPQPARTGRYRGQPCPVGAVDHHPAVRGQLPYRRAGSAVGERRQRYIVTVESAPTAPATGRCDPTRRGPGRHLDRHAGRGARRGSDSAQRGPGRFDLVVVEAPSGRPAGHPAPHQRATSGIGR